MRVARYVKMSTDVGTAIFVMYIRFLVLMIKFSSKLYIGFDFGDHRASAVCLEHIKSGKSYFRIILLHQNNN